MEDKVILTSQEEKVFEMVQKECKKNVYCFSYIKTIGRRLRLKYGEVENILQKLEEKNLVICHCKKTLFQKYITKEYQEFSKKYEKIILKYKKSKDVYIIEKVIESKFLNAISLWIYLKIVSILRKKMLVSVKDIVDEIGLSQGGKHNWINATWIIRMLEIFEEQKFSQWEKV